MKKALSVLFAVLFGTLVLMTDAHAKEVKVQLHDTVTLDTFIETYNKLSEYPVTDYSNHSTRGDYEAYVAVLDQENAMLIHTNGAGLISNILFMHRGGIAEADRKKLASVFVCSNIAMGYEMSDDAVPVLTEAFDRLDISSPEVLASRLDRQDIGRMYTFLKTVSQEKNVYMILMEAVVE